MLRDFADLVRNLIGDSKAQKPSTKPANPLRDAMMSNGGRETGVPFLMDEFLKDPWNLGFTAILLKDGKVWKLPSDKVTKMMRDYRGLAEVSGGTNVRDIVEEFGCAVAIFHAEVENVGVRLHMPRTCGSAVLVNAREIRRYVEAHNKAERAEYETASVAHKIMRDPHILSFRVMAYEGEKIYRNAILR